MKSNVQKKSNKARNRRKKTQKRVFEYRRQVKILNNELSFEKMWGDPLPHVKPIRPRDNPKRAINAVASLHELCENEPDQYSALKTLLEDRIFIIENGLIFNSKNEIVCEVSLSSLEQFNKTSLLKQA